METQANAKKPKLIELRVTRKKYMESVNDAGQVRIVPGPWNHKVKYNKREYGPGDTFKALPEHAEKLIATGTVQLAESKEKPFRPPSLTHEIELRDGVHLRDDLLGKIPTRMGSDKDAPWIDRGDDGY